MYQKVDHPERECAFCGAMFKPKTKSTRFCCKPCSRSHWVENNPEVAAECKRKAREQTKAKGYSNPLRGPFSCKNCGKQYSTTRPKGEGEKYCSRGCAFTDIKTWIRRVDAAPKFSRVQFNKCSHCKRWFRTANKGRKYCSKECAAIVVGKRGDKTATVVCLTCGVAFSRLYGNSSLTCSDLCKDDLRKKNHRNAKAARRARKRGNNAEVFDPIAVLARDKWTCQACRRKTPPRLRGTIKPNAPELDHIVPLSLGGEHSRRNTQCLCRECNQAKGAGVLTGGEQLRLMA